MDNEKVDKFLDLLDKTREERLELLPEAGTFVEVIADAMNALQVAFVMVNAIGEKAPPPQAVFVPSSKPQNAKKI